MSDGPSFRPPVFEQPNFRADAQGELDEGELDEEEFEDEAFGDDESGDDEVGDDEAGSPAANRADGGTARAVLEHVARSLVDEPDAVQVDVAPGRSGERLSLHVAAGDMGRVIGRRGRVAQAIRAVVRAAAARDGTDATVDIVD